MSIVPLAARVTPLVELLTVDRKVISSKPLPGVAVDVTPAKAGQVTISLPGAFDMPIPTNIELVRLRFKVATAAGNSTVDHGDWTATVYRHEARAE